MASILKHCAFIHIPRTGSTFIRTALRECNIPHKNSGNGKHNIHTIHATLRDVWPEVIGKYYIFSFVRNPITYLQSMYVKRPKPFIKYLPFDIESCENFQQFAEKYASCKGRYVTKTFNRFLSYNELFDKVALVGKLENIVEQLIAFLKLAEEEFDENIIRNMNPMHVGARKVDDQLWYPSRDVLSSIISNEIDTFIKYKYSTKVDSYAQFYK